MITVRDGLLDLFLELTGVGSAIALACGRVIGELRQLGVTKVSTPHRRTKTCLAIYQSPQVHSTNARKRKLDITRNLVGQTEETLLCFTLVGEEHLDARLNAHESQGDAGPFSSVARTKGIGWGVPPSSGGMLAAGVVCVGVTVVNQES